MDLALSMESALDGSCVLGMSTDWSKCIDRVPHGIAFKLAERQGINPRVLQAASSGVIQGCPLSVLFTQPSQEHLGQIRESCDHHCNAERSTLTTRESSAMSVKTLMSR